MIRLRSVLLALLAIVVAMPTSLASAQVSLNGAGATFPRRSTRSGSTSTPPRRHADQLPADRERRGHPSDHRQDGRFGASDGILTEQQQAAAPDVLHIPMTSGPWCSRTTCRRSRGS